MIDATPTFNSPGKSTQYPTKSVNKKIDANRCVSFLWTLDLVDEYQQYQEATVDEDDDDEDNYDDED